MFKATIEVTLKRKILDPQGKAIESSLHNLGFSKLGGIRTGKNIEMSIDEADIESASAMVRSACTKLLSNPVTEDYEYQIFDQAGSLVASGGSSSEFSGSRASDLQSAVDSSRR